MSANDRSASAGFLSGVVTMFLVMASPPANILILTESHTCQGRIPWRVNSVSIQQFGKTVLGWEQSPSLSVSLHLAAVPLCISKVGSFFFF